MGRLIPVGFLAGFTALAACLLAVLLLGIGSVANADEDDHERARQLREAGTVLPLSEIIASLQQRQPGRVLEAKMDQEHGRWIYEVELLADDGAVWEFEVDAASGELLERERKH